MKSTNYNYWKRCILLVALFFASASSFAFEHNVGDGAHGLSRNPSAVVYQDQLWVFNQGRKDNGQLQFRVMKNGEWSLQSTVPNVKMSEGPGAVVYKDKIYIFHQGGGRDGKLYYVTYDGKNFSADKKLENVAMSNSPAAVVYNNKLYVFHLGTAKYGQLRYSVFDGSKWLEDQTLGNGKSMSASPGATVYNGKLYVFYQSEDYKGALKYNVLDGTSWAGAKVVPNMGMSVTPSPVVYENKIFVFHQRYGKTGEMMATKFDGSKFETVKMPNIFMSHAPGSAVYQNKLYVFYQYGKDKGYLWHVKKENGSWSMPTTLVGFSFKNDGLMDKKFGTFTIPGTHNSYIAPPLFISGNNSHDEEVPYQLNQGIRFVELDVNNVSFPWNVNLEKSVAIVHGKFWGGTIFGQRNVRFGIWELKDFLEKNPNELIILKIDSPATVSYENMKYFFQKYGIYDKIYTKREKDWTALTPRDILKTGKQILLMAIYNNCGDMDCKIGDKMNNSASWGGNNIETMSPVAGNKDKVNKNLYVIAMYGTEDPLGFGSSSKDRIMNEYAWTKNHFLKGWRTSAMRPFSFVHDYSTYGDVMEVIREMNVSYNSVRGDAVDAAGNSIKDIQYKVMYSSDGKVIYSKMSSSFDFPAKVGETVIIQPIKEGKSFSPASFTYTNTGNQDAQVIFKERVASSSKSMKADLEQEDPINEGIAPNPFNSEITLSIDLPEAANVNLKLYDIKGAEVANMDLGYCSEGVQKIHYQIEDLQKGMFIYKCVAGNKMLTGKLIKQ